MFNVVDELVNFCQRHGVPAWVTDEFGRCLRLDEWAEQLVDRYADQVAATEHEEAERLRALRSMICDKPRKSIAVSKILEIIDD